MDYRKEYGYLLATYIIVIISVILFSNTFITIALLLGSFAYSFYLIFEISKDLHLEKDTSVSSLLNKLDKTQKETEETYKRFLSLSTTLGSGVFMVNEEGIITFSNKDIENYFSINFNQLSYHELHKIPPLYSFIERAILVEDYTRNQIEHNDNYYDLISTPLFEEDIFVGALFLVHDITQLKTAEQFQKQFTADVSHELRTPLSAIKGFSEIMLRDSQMTEENRKEFVGLINKESVRMESILQDLMTISKIDRLDYELQIESYDIKAFLEETLTVLQQKFNDKKLDRIMEIESCKIEFDRVKMSQVILNVVKNAINYTDKGYIKIKGYKKGNNYRIEIKDSGIGIAEEDKEKIFKRFYRVDKARSRDSGGSGLGLSISKNVILKHNGKISVKSKLNQGSTFRITIPLSQSK